MQMQVESRNREAFELVTDAVEFIDEYRASRDVEKLTTATSKLALAREKDPSYFRAQYYDAIVDDLAGRSKEAATKLRALVGQPSPFINEVRYNLALAEYHAYNHEALDRAIEQFSTVLTSAVEASLRLRARAGLAQAYAMHMIPKTPAEPDVSAIENYRKLALTSAADALKKLRYLRLQRWIPFRKLQLDSKVAAEIPWTAHNAIGMALMYYSDYLPKHPSESEHAHLKRRLDTLEKALAEMAMAERSKADDWANRCDMGSANMRLGYWKKDKASFDTALLFLHAVVERLRPGYGFASYEIGRTHRLNGDFEQAAKAFETALQVPSALRDVCDRRLNIELERAKNKDRSFP